MTTIKKSGRVKVEFKNSRYADSSLKERLTELQLYSKYAGIDLSSFRKSLSTAKVLPGNQGVEQHSGGKIVVELDAKTAIQVLKLVDGYPVFSTWDIKVSELNDSKAKSKVINKKKETRMAVKKKKAAAKKKKAAPKKKAAAKKKKAAPKKKKKAAAKKKKAAPKKKKKAAAKKKKAAPKKKKKAAAKKKRRR